MPSSSPPIRLFAARHGDCLALKEGRVAGNTESPLTPEGYGEAGLLRDRVAERLKQLGITSGVLFVAGTLSRITDTAAAVRDKVAPDQPIITLKEFNEADAGALTDHPMVEMDELLVALQADPSMKLPDGMESPRELHARVGVGLDKLLEQAQLVGASTVVLVMSNGPSRDLLGRAGGQPPESMAGNPGLKTGDFVELQLAEDGTIMYPAE